MNEEKWHKRWFALCNLVASWSSDSTKVGAVIVDSRNSVLAIGWNDLPRNVLEKEQRRERPVKYMWTEHAERNAIYNAAAIGASLKGTTLYTQATPCADCARAIIQSGITRVVVQSDELNERWKESEDIAHQMFWEAGIELELK